MQDKLKKKALDSMLGEVHNMMGKSLAPKSSTTLPDETSYSGKDPKAMVVKQSATGVLMPEPRKSMLDEPEKAYEPDEELKELREKTDIGEARAKDYLGREKLAKNIGLESESDLANPLKTETQKAGLTNLKVTTDQGDIDVDQETYNELQKLLNNMQSETDFPQIEVNGKVLNVKGLGGNKVTIYRKK